MKRLFSALLAATSLTLIGCTAEDKEPSDANAQGVTLQVLAAASLQSSFDEIAAAFRADRPHVSIELNYAGSSTLVQNLAAGAPADVFASADEAHMAQAQQADLIDAKTSEVFAANRLVGIVPTDNPANITSLEETTAEDVNLVVCAPQVPCGALAHRVADTAGISLAPVSEEQHVSDVLGKVRTGQADAGLVYATEAALAPQEVEVFDVQGAQDDLNYYPIARTSNSQHPRVAEEFLEFVQAQTGQEILGRHGFTQP